MRIELAETRRALEKRKQIDRAKGIVMRARGMTEEEVYALARKMADAGHDFIFVDARAVGLALLTACTSLRIGGPFAFSMHAELVRYWLTALGGDAAMMQVRTIPPPRMANALAAGEIDAFCVGETWGSVAVGTGAGRSGSVRRKRFWPSAQVVQKKIHNWPVDCCVRYGARRAG